MRIVCAKTPRPLGVRGRGDGAYVFCPVRTEDETIKYNDDRVTMAECQKCEHHRGVHEVIAAIPSDIPSHRKGIPTRQSVHKRIVLSREDIKQYELGIKKWLEDEMTRIAQVFEDVKRDTENVEEKQK